MPRPDMLTALKAFAARLKRQLRALYFAARDARTSWYAKVLAACVVAYALSPIDLIPDMIPILGYLDDLVLVPLGIYLVIRLIPPAVLAECQARAAATDENLPRNRTAAVMIVLVWLLTTIVAVYFLVGFL